jgi:hypothetical protein
MDGWKKMEEDEEERWGGLGWRVPFSLLSLFSLNETKRICFFSWYELL